MIMLSFYLLVISSATSPVKPLFARSNTLRVNLTRTPCIYVFTLRLFLEMKSTLHIFYFYRYISVYTYLFICLSYKQSSSNLKT